MMRFDSLLLLFGQRHRPGGLVCVGVVAGVVRQTDCDALLALSIDICGTRHRSVPSRVPVGFVMSKLLVLPDPLCYDILLQLGLDWNLRTARCCKLLLAEVRSIFLTHGRSILTRNIRPCFNIRQYLARQERRRRVGGGVDCDTWDQYLGQFSFGPVLLLDELQRSHATLPVPSQPCNYFHPALHSGASLVNALRLVAALWWSPEWIRFFLVQHVAGSGKNCLVTYHKRVVYSLELPVFWIQLFVLGPTWLLRGWMYWIHPKDLHHSIEFFAWDLLAGLLFQGGWTAMTSLVEAIETGPRMSLPSPISPKSQSIIDTMMSNMYLFNGSMIMMAATPVLQDFILQVLMIAYGLYTGTNRYWIAAGLACGICTAGLCYGPRPELFRAMPAYMLVGALVFGTINTWAGWGTLIRLSTSGGLALAGMTYIWVITEKLQSTPIQPIHPHNRVHIATIVVCVSCLVLLCAFRNVDYEQERKYHQSIITM